MACSSYHQEWRGTRVVELVGFHLYLEELKSVYSKTCCLEILCRVAVGDIAECWLCSSAHLSSKSQIEI